MSQTIPIIDFQPFLEDSPHDVRLQTAKELVQACHDVGFVYIRNHGLSQAELDQAFAISKKFFDLDVQDKMKAPHPPGWAIHRGYSWPGLEKVSNALNTADDAETVKKLREIQDYKESYEIGSEHNADMPNVWPPEHLLPEWRPFMTKFYWSCFEVAKTILKALALGLELTDEDALLQAHSGVNNQLRLLHYPPIPEEWLESKRYARMPTHSDWSTFTFLFQDDCGGLQAESSTNDGTFLDVTPVAGTLVLNVGDLLMQWSNDYFHSTQHRVILPPTTTKASGKLTQARYSIPYFVSPDPDVMINCLDTKSTGVHKYKPITQRQYAAMRARMQY